jgi:transposase
MCKEEVLENYRSLWKIEKAFKVAKNELKIRPIFHYKRQRIEAHICLNFVAYKIYKELERQLRDKKSEMSPEKVIEIIQNIYQINLKTPNNELVSRTIILSEEQKEVQTLFNF